jgi:taurine--2-oxoglutarate transaminase
MFIADEVMAGFGRSGKWFSIDHFDVVPDLLTFAKGVNSGYVPAGGVVIADHISADFDDTVFPGGLTYSGHPLAMAAIVAALDAMKDEGIVENAATVGLLKSELLKRGLLPFTADNRIHVVPPCTVTAEQVAAALAIYDEAFTAVEAI